MSFQIPKEIQEKLGRFEQLKAQLQVVMGQRSEMEARVKELDDAVSALSEKGNGEIYRKVGDLMFKVEDKGSLEKEMVEEKETLSVRLSSLKKQEDNMKEMYEELGSEINESLKGYQ
ncbi:MAG: prefoldin subunit beta [Thermoplasmatota archaeon]